MKEVLLVLPKDKLRALGGRDIKAMIKENLPKVEETLLAGREEVLLEKMARLEEKLREMEEEMEELGEFYEKALGDRAFLTAERDRIKEENARLRAEFEKNRRGRG
ncbi:hypothetical protein [Thermococcus sp.]|uniref:hypothetical protein n=1 Tax=Thermococcus sp. TaxID=35749 RepID=UPI0026232879|nr:hypothetical protein [Thermococcus sp.]